MAEFTLDLLRFLAGAPAALSSPVIWRLRGAAGALGFGVLQFLPMATVGKT